MRMISVMPWILNDTEAAEKFRFGLQSAPPAHCVPPVITDLWHDHYGGWKCSIHAEYTDKITNVIAELKIKKAKKSKKCGVSRHGIAAHRITQYPLSCSYPSAHPKLVFVYRLNIEAEHESFGYKPHTPPTLPSPSHRQLSAEKLNCRKQ